jgi:hypothetical protein
MYIFNVVWMFTRPELKKINVIQNV